MVIPIPIDQKTVLGKEKVFEYLIKVFVIMCMQLSFCKTVFSNINFFFFNFCFNLVILIEKNMNKETKIRNGIERKMSKVCYHFSIYKYNYLKVESNYPFFLCDIVSTVSDTNIEKIFPKFNINNHVSHI